MGHPNEIFVVFKGYNAPGAADIGPDDPADLLLLLFDPAAFGLAQKVDHLLFDVRLWKIFHHLPESRLQPNLQPCLLAHLAQCCLYLGLIPLHMSFGKDQWPP